MRAWQVFSVSSGLEKSMGLDDFSLTRISYAKSPPARGNAPLTRRAPYNPPMIPWLTENDRFPPVERALKDPNGLLAAGADLSVPRLIEAYQNGIFPWYSD